MKYVEIVSITLFCDFDLSNFPFDHHDCYFTFKEDEYPQKVVDFDSPLVKYKDFSTNFGSTG